MQCSGQFLTEAVSSLVVSHRGREGVRRRRHRGRGGGVPEVRVYGVLGQGARRMISMLGGGIFVAVARRLRI